MIRAAKSDQPARPPDGFAQGFAAFTAPLHTEQIMLNGHPELPALH
jgi:hypothetical protein